MDLSTSIRTSTASLLAAATFFSAGCGSDSNRQAQGNNIKDLDLSNAALPSLVIDRPSPVAEGMYEIPAAQLKEWAKKYSEDNPHRLILWVAPSAMATRTYNAAFNNATTSDHITAFLVYTAPRAELPVAGLKAER